MWAPWETPVQALLGETVTPCWGTAEQKPRPGDQNHGAEAGSLWGPQGPP